MTKPATYLESSLAKYARLLTDPKSVEIVINADGQIWIERAGNAGMTLAGFPALTGQELVEFASNLAGGAGARLGEASPLVSGSVDFRGRKLRLQILAQPAVAQGPPSQFASLAKHRPGAQHQSIFMASLYRSMKFGVKR